MEKKRNVNLRLPKSLQLSEVAVETVQSERRLRRFEMTREDTVRSRQDLIKHLHHDIQRTSTCIRELNQFSPERQVRTSAPSPVASDFPIEPDVKLLKMISALEREK
jgi:hypothetical protein